MLISGFGGMTVISFFVLICVIYIDSVVECEDWIDPMSTAMVVYYFLWTFMYFVIATGVCVQVFKRYQINYPMILELDPSTSSVTHFEFYKLAVILGTIWTWCLTLQVASFKFGWRANTRYPNSMLDSR